MSEIEKAIVKKLSEQIRALVEENKTKLSVQVNYTLLATYWNIGKFIVALEEVEQLEDRSLRVLIADLSKQLKSEVGKGYSRSNLTYMRLFYQYFPAGVTLSHQLSWSHYIELIKIDDPLERSFYEQQALSEKWSVRTLRRQRNTALFQRLAINKNREEILALAKKGQSLQSAEDIIKDPYVLEFLDLVNQADYTERDLENNILNNLQAFLLELGKGFAFVGNQHRITLNNRHYYVDLVFYHRILKCFVLIDLKIGEVVHGDVGQMNMYLNYFEKEENEESDNAPIGIILAAAKDEIMIEYATGKISNQIFVSKYQTHLPNREVLEQRVRYLLEQNISKMRDEEE